MHWQNHSLCACRMAAFLSTCSRHPTQLGTCYTYLNAICQQSHYFLSCFFLIFPCIICFMLLFFYYLFAVVYSGLLGSAVTTKLSVRSISRHNKKKEYCSYNELSSSTIKQAYKSNKKTNNSKSTIRRTDTRSDNSKKNLKNRI